MKISQKTIQYILLALIVVIAFCAYQFGYVKFIESANKVKTENKAIEARINDLTDKETHRADWTGVISKTDENIDVILAKYGPGNTPEKSIVFVRDLENASNMTVSGLSFSQDVPIFQSSDVDENGNPTVEIDSSILSINYSTTYDGLKACMDFINKYKERMNVSCFTASCDQETGDIIGNMVINLYAVKDAKHEYVAPVIDNVDIGVQNIFGSGYTFNTGDSEENGEEPTGEGTENETEGTGEGEGEGEGAGETGE